MDEETVNESIGAQTESLEEQGSRGDVAGAPTRPAAPAGAVAPPAPPPVGLSWTALARQSEIDMGLLQQSGGVVLTGEYFPESGFAIDPNNGLARHVDVGDQALRPCYFLGELALREYHGRLPLDPNPPIATGAVVVGRDSAPLIGLFVDRAGAQRAHERLLRGSLAEGMTIEDGPLGTELHVAGTEQPGRVAGEILAQNGALISLSGRPVQTGEGPLATGGAGAGDAPRGGTGALGDSRAPGMGTHEQGYDPS